MGDFWAHEWTKHGTCTGMDQGAYFGAALDAYADAPGLIRDNYGGSVLLRELEGFYDGNAVVVCQGNYLSEVRKCLAVGEGGEPSNPIKCPGSVRVEGNCEETVIVPAFEVDESACHPGGVAVVH